MRINAHHPSLSSLLQHFTPNWFAVSMGTGITGLCLGSLPWQIAWIHDLALGIWLINFVLFIVFFTLWLSSVLLFPKIQLDLLRHSTLPFFLGCIPMALTTIVNGFILFGLPLYGDIALKIAENLWEINAVLSIFVAIIVPYFMFTHHQHAITTATTLWLLPIIAPEVAASSAGLVAAHLDPAIAHRFVIAGYLLWGISLPLAFGIIIIFIQRMIFHKLPEKSLGATIWLPLGPIAMGAYGLMTLGVAGGRIVASSHLFPWLNSLNSVGMIGAVILLGFASWILLIALFITLHYVRNGLPYNMTFWSFTFPLGVYTLAVLTLGKLIGIVFFAYYGALLTLILTFIWLFVAWKTLPGLLRGDLIRNPLL